MGMEGGDLYSACGRAAGRKPGGHSTGFVAAKARHRSASPVAALSGWQRLRVAAKAWLPLSRAWLLVTDCMLGIDLVDVIRCILVPRLHVLPDGKGINGKGIKEKGKQVSCKNSVAKVMESLAFGMLL